MAHVAFMPALALGAIEERKLDQRLFAMAFLAEPEAGTRDGTRGWLQQFLSLAVCPLVFCDAIRTGRAVAAEAFAKPELIERLPDVATAADFHGGRTLNRCAANVLENDCDPVNRQPRILAI
jgi:hypothetical protein